MLKEAEGTGHRVKTRRYGGRKGGSYDWIAENRLCSWRDREGNTAVRARAEGEEEVAKE